MKGVGKILVGFTIVTGALLLYVTERVEMLRVSYRIHDKSSRLSERAEEYRRLSFEVARLRSPHNLQTRLGELPLTLTLPQEIQVLRVPEAVARPETNPLHLHAPSPNLLDFFGQWIQIAQARTEQ
jgi:hypothetical protein